MDAIQFAALLKKCSSPASLQATRRAHALILTTPFALSQLPFLNNNLISAYVRCGSLTDARQVFDQMLQRNPVSYNALISAYSRTPSHAASALLLLRDMVVVDDLKPNASTLSSLLQACSLLGDRWNGVAVHAQVVESGFLNDLCVQTSLLGLYSNCRNLESANRAFGEMRVKDVVAWNSVIYANMGENVELGFELFGCMVRSALVPSQFSYSIVFNACGKLGDVLRGKAIHARVIVSGIPPDVPLQNSLVDMYSSCGDMEAAFLVFQMIEQPDLISWNSMIAGYSENENGEMAMAMFVQLKHNCLKKPDEYSFASTISATGSLSSLNYGESLHAQVTKLGYDSSVFVVSTTIGMYLKNEKMDNGRKLFDSMTRKDTILFTEMISGHSKLQEGEYAIKYFNQMQEEGHRADSFVLSSVLNAAADLAALKQGQVMHSLVLKTGYEADMCVCGSLVDMYAKNGDLQAAHSVFSRALNPDLKCWNALLGGFSHHGEAGQAFQLFDDMLKIGHQPDRVTFVSLLSACSHRGLVERGRFYWRYMSEFGISPGIKHYSSMVCLLGRVGLLEEAEDLIVQSPFSDMSPELWRILLSSCVNYKDLNMGVHAAERAFSISPEDSATLSLLTNLYAAAGRWDAVSKMRIKMRGLNTPKDPGLSWTEIGQDVTVFSANDATVTPKKSDQKNRFADQ